MTEFKYRKEEYVYKYVLYTYAYGAGWASWYSGRRDVYEFMVHYEPFIDHILQNGKGPIPPDLILSFKKDFVETFGLNEELPYLGGLCNLDVYDIDYCPDYYIEDYDGKEVVYLE